MSPDAVARRPKRNPTLTARRSPLVVRGSSLVARITLPVTRRSLSAARCSLSAGPSLAPECTPLSPVASSLWGLTARRYAAAVSGSCDPPHPRRGQHHRLVRPEQVTWVCKPRGPPFFAHHLRRSLPADRRALPVDRCLPRNAGRRTKDVARRASPAVGRFVARRRSPTPNAQPDAHGTQAVARSPLFVARCPHHAARHPSFVVRSPLFVVRWPKFCS